MIQRQWGSRQDGVRWENSRKRYQQMGCECLESFCASQPAPSTKNYWCQVRDPFFLFCGITRCLDEGKARLAEL